MIQLIKIIIFLLEIYLPPHFLFKLKETKLIISLKFRISDILFKSEYYEKASKKYYYYYYFDILKSII